MTLRTIEIETAPEPRTTIMLMHGLGADGSDFASLTQELRLESVGPVRFVFPCAPTMPVTINGGYVMPAWYDILALNGQAGEDERGLRQSQSQIEELLAREKARGIPAERIVLAGFSQGCAMALMTGLRHAEQLAGIAGLSGYLPLATTTALERHMANATTPIFLAHGQQDEMISLQRANATRDALALLGYSVDLRSYRMGHSVCMEEVADLNRWLLRVLAT